MRSFLPLLLLALFLLAGCVARSPYLGRGPATSQSYDEEYDGAYGGAPAEAVAADMAPSRSMRRAESKSAGAPPPPPSPAPAMAPGSPPAPPVSEPQAAPQQPVDRMVHYDGWARLRVTRVEETLDQVAALAEKAGGKVESLYAGTVVVAVPVARFEEAFAAILGFGDVLDKSISATDVTEAFTSTELRLRTAEATRSRLQYLLTRAEDEQEKLQLLREIARLTETIDLLRGQVELLSSLAAFSRITVEAVPRQAVTQRAERPEPAGLGWIQQLSAFRQDVVAAGKLLELEVPEGFVALDVKKRFVAESADGAVIRSGRLENVPAGDTAFWMEAVRERLAPEFATATVETWGGFQVLTLVDGSDEPYVYLVALRAQGSWLDLVEVSYPGRAQQQRHGAAVKASIEAAGGISQVPVAREGRLG